MRSNGPALSKHTDTGHYFTYFRDLAKPLQRRSEPPQANAKTEFNKKVRLSDGVLEARPMQKSLRRNSVA